MTLLELLVQELPKRGGWPDRVSRISQDDDTEIRFYTHTGEAPEYDFYPQQKDNCGDRINITREQYEAALAQTEWSGEGLPPVGCECHFDDDGIPFGLVKILAHDRGVVVFKTDTDGYHGIKPSKVRVFRPIRSEADRKRDEAVKAMVNHKNDPVDVTENRYHAIYDAIAAGKIPHIRID